MPTADLGKNRDVPTAAGHHRKDFACLRSDRIPVVLDEFLDILSKFAIFDTYQALLPKQNLMLRKGDECIYAKVIRPEDPGYLICFTSVTQNFKET